MSACCDERRGMAARVVLLALIVAAVGGTWLTFQLRKSDAVESEPLLVFCAASNRSAFELVRRDYEAEFHVPIQVQYGPSQTLLANIEVSRSGDWYLPADDGFIAMAKARGLTAEEFPLAEMRMVVAVMRGNPKQIASWHDLLRSDVRVAQASPETTAIGKLARNVLSASGKWDEFTARTVTYKTTVNEVANDVAIGAIDAGIVFDAVLHDYPALEAVSLPELREGVAQVTGAVLNTSRRPQQALHFARYLSARDKGLRRYRDHGFRTVEGDRWSDPLELTLYAGSMLRPAIERTIADFENREGVRVLRVYNGCGILVAQMKAGTLPDAYFACDVEFMNQVRELFPASTDVSRNELVILVKKGNPLGIRSLKDLAKAELRVGIGHEKQCAMGWITQRTFQEGGVRNDVMKNVVVQTPTGDMLVNQMRSGALDAAVAYLSNAAGSADTLDAIRIEGLRCSIATQPYAAAEDSPHKRTMQRLLDAIRSEASRQAFRKEGFSWLDEAAARP